MTTNTLRPMIVAAALLSFVLASGILEAQESERITPLTAPIALWCSENGNKSILAYSIDQDGEGHFAWRFTPNEATVSTTTAATSASSSDTGALIDQGGIALFRAPDGRYAAVTTQGDSKRYSFFFHPCPDVGSTETVVAETEKSAAFATSAETEADVADSPGGVAEEGGASGD